ncbi:MAG TPA: cytochrome c biogenesis protein ResB [Gammaproteobacteria bacterium]
MTLLLLPLFIGLVLIYSFQENRNPLLIAIPLFLLAANLLAASITSAQFRHQLPLLMFHLSLLLLVLLTAIGRLSALEGETEITVGEEFSARGSSVRSGPLHRSALDSVKFMLNEFTIQYEPDRDGLSRGATHCRVSWVNNRGETMQGTIGDHLPLILHGYRFYTTHNKGFAPVFLWQPKRGKAQQGSIHLPSYPANEHTQALSWSLPGTDHHLWTQLQFDEVILDLNKSSSFHPPKHHQLIVRVGESRSELVPGMAIELTDGRLIYTELRSWMGFKISSDWTLPWLIAAGIIAAVSLGWHYWRRFSAVPWSNAS